MSAPSPPPDRSVELRQLELDAAERQRQQEAAEAARRKEELAQLRSTATNTGRSGAESYFTNQGLDAGQYSSEIDAVIQRILGGIAPDDPNPGSYFANAGSTAYNEAETGYRGKNMRALDSIFAPNFEMSRVPFTLDDPYIEGFMAEERSEADDILRNMLERGVITQTGFNAGSADLDKQAPGARARLSEIGTGLLAGGQGQLRDVANRGRSTASQLRLGQQFDPYAFGGEADAAFSDFLANLSGNIRAAAPGDLFKTAGLGAIAGAAQGAGNTAFNPNFMDEEDEDEDDRQAEPVF